MTLDELRTYKKILLLGYGIEGKTSERFIKKFHPDAEIGYQNYDQPGYLENQEDYDLAIRTPFLAPDKITIPYTTATNLFFANVPNVKVGITGTKGKSTTASLLHHVLKTAGKKSRLYGNVGIPMLEALIDGVDPDDMFVLELSSYQLQDIKYSPHIACFLNIYEELHNHETFEEYFEAKCMITQFQNENDQFFYNGKFPEIAAVKTHAQRHDFTLQDVHVPQELPFTTHIDNLKAVFDMSTSLEGEEAFYDALKTFKPLPHRMHNVGTFGNITFYDDSSSTHPDASTYALNALDNVTSVILGGQDRGYVFTSLAKTLAEKNIGTIILLPETEEKIYNEISEQSEYHPHIIRVQSLQEAVVAVFSHTKDGICLLSPGAPSYVMFLNFGERGDEFVKNIEEYAKKNNLTQKEADRKKDASS